mmetsp:Transcript_33332/g.32399  ORF Transcript_33332/g.32399 Transcript_33332/m.32399 type:complete len:128 (+) Transcript_33332:968-1351(+)
MGDKVEASVIKRVMGTPLDEIMKGQIREENNIDYTNLPGPSLNSLKGSIGHLMEASGAAELALTIQGMQEGLVIGTTNLKKPVDPELGFIKHGEHKKKSVERVIKLNMGFGNSVGGLALWREPSGRY